MKRYLILLLATAALGIAQESPPPPPVGYYFPARLVQYFELSDSQARMIGQLNQDSNRLAASKQQRMFEVQEEIAVETAKDQLDPMALGLRYLELEVIRRELKETRATLTANIGKILNDPQKVKLKALDDALKLQQIISEADCENILDPFTPSGFATFLLGTSFPTTVIRACSFRSGDFRNFPADLKQYFDLTESQTSMIVQLNSDYNQLAATKQQRMFQVQQEISVETARDSIDPMVLGVRYAELAGIRRELQDALAAVRSKIGDILNAAQKAKLKSLDDARKLQPVIADAQCENMLGPSLVTANVFPVPLVGFPDVVLTRNCSVGSFSFVSP